MYETGGWEKSFPIAADKIPYLENIAFDKQWRLEERWKHAVLVDLDGKAAQFHEPLREHCESSTARIIVFLTGIPKYNNDGNQ